MPLTSPRASRTAYPEAPLEWTDKPSPEHRRRIAQTANSAIRGHLNNSGSVTLGAGTSTTITDSRITAGSIVVLVPISSLGAAEIATTYISDTADGSATVSHLSGSITGRVYAYLVFGATEGTLYSALFPSLHTSDHSSEFE